MCSNADAPTIINMITSRCHTHAALRPLKIDAEGSPELEASEQVHLQSLRQKDADEWEDSTALRMLEAQLWNLRLKQSSMEDDGYE